MVVKSAIIIRIEKQLANDLIGTLENTPHHVHGGILPLCDLPRTVAICLESQYLERRYPYLKKRPYLLPVAWVQRIVHYAGEQSGADNSASGSIKLGKERIELMKRYGIIDEKK